MKSILIAVLSFITAVYTVWYMHFEKPWTNSGALSSIGLDHRILFAVWGSLTFLSLGGGILIGYIRLKKIKLCLPLLALSVIGMALTLCFRFEYGAVPDYYLHCFGSLLFSAVTGFTIFLLFLLSRQRVLTVLTAVILLSDLIFLIMFKETGLIEVFPIFAGYIMLSYTNVKGENVETERTAAHT